jgi:hypothetical protein
VVPIEDRVRVLEEEVARLKQQLSTAAQQEGWWKRISGSMQDFPEFEQVLRLGQEYRAGQRSGVDDLNGAG